MLSYEGLGRVYARRPALRQRAVSYFYRAIEADATRADLYYQMAAVYFDIGTRSVRGYGVSSDCD